ncbi:MAG: carbohydrate ABC transporter permease [Chloroflexota bacterium]
MKTNLRHMLFLAALVVLMVLFAFPLVWMLSYSLRPLGLPEPTRLELFTRPLALDNYARLGSVIPLGTFTLNSLRVVALAVPLTVLTASWAGFALAQLPRRITALLLTLSVALLLVPSPSLWVPRFLIFTELDWVDTLAPLIAPALMGTSPFYVIMFTIAFARLPRDVVESARLDGAHVLTTWAAIAMPLVRPTVVAVTLLSFAFYWSDYVSPLLYLRAEANYTLPVGIQLLQQAYKSNWPLLMAAAVVMVAPVVLFFVSIQRWFLQGQIALSRWLR